MGATMTLYLTISGIACAVVFFGVPLIVGYFAIPLEDQEAMTWLLRLSAILWPLRAVFATHGAVPMALQRYDLTTKLNVLQSVLRSAGFIALALAGYGVIHLVLWDLLSQAVAFGIQAVLVRRIAPGIQLWPSLSFKALREIAGFSVFSFLTFGFLMLQRESGKLVLAAKLGAAPVAFFGTPDSISQRIHMVVASGSETLMPRFSANRDPTTARSLIYYGTWTSLIVSLICLLPLVVLMPDFLRLWISPEFSRESAGLGQLVALSYITQGAYTPVATFFRGTGEPFRVTLVIACAGVLTLLACLLLIPRFGVVGAGYACLIGSVPTLVGLLHGWRFVFGPSSLPSLARVVGLPLLMGGVAFFVQHRIHVASSDMGVLELVLLGGLFLGITAGLILGADWLVGGTDAPSKRFFQKVSESRRFERIRRRFRMKSGS
jgi:O-antigen/teichoic acid export membrane protein